MDLIDNGLSEAQLRAARLIAMGMGYKDVATELGVNRTTLYRWRRSPAFSEQVSRLMSSAREGVRERVIRDVAEVKDLVLDTLIDVARNSTQDSARVAAARTLGEFMERAEERADRNRMMSCGTSQGRLSRFLSISGRSNLLRPPECN